MTSNLSLVSQYKQQLESTFSTILAKEEAHLVRGAEWIADTIARDSIIFTLGSGHSLLVAIELYYRAGGLANFDIIQDKTFGRAERLPGYAQVLLEQYPIHTDDLLIIVSNSGRNELPVEMALEARKRGIRTIGITSLAHSLSVKPRTKSGKRLSEVVDLVIDNCGLIGDASVELISPNGPLHTGPTSTAAGVFIANTLVSLAAADLIRRGIVPPIFASANTDSGDKNNQALLSFLRERIRGI